MSKLDGYNNGPIANFIVTLVLLSIIGGAIVSIVSPNSLSDPWQFYVLIIVGVAWVLVMWWRMPKVLFRIDSEHEQWVDCQRKSDTGFWNVDKQRAADRALNDARTIWFFKQVLYLVVVLGLLGWFLLYPLSG